MYMYAYKCFSTQPDKIHILPSSIFSSNLSSCSSLIPPSNLYYYFLLGQDINIDPISSFASYYVSDQLASTDLACHRFPIFSTRAEPNHYRLLHGQSTNLDEWTEDRDPIWDDNVTIYSLAT